MWKLTTVLLIAGLGIGGSSQNIHYQFSNDASSPQSVERMKRLHQSYLKRPLPIYNEDSLVRYFTIPPEDLQKLQGEMGDDFGGCRIYLGFDEERGDYHFILSGISAGTGENFLKDDYLFDEFFPCPRRCGSSRPRKTDLIY